MAVLYQICISPTPSGSEILKGREVVIERSDRYHYVVQLADKIEYARRFQRDCSRLKPMVV